MRSDDWRDMDSAPLNPYGKAWGPTVLIWCRGDDTPWPAYFEPWHSWKDRDCGPAWIIADDSGPPIAPEDALAWMPIAAPWSVALKEGEEIMSKSALLKGETLLNGVKEITPEHAHRMREWLLETSGRLHQLVGDERMLKPSDMHLLATYAARVANNE